MTYRILIVDDEPDLVDWYAESLSDDYRIVTAQTGRDAIERVKRSSDIDLAVIDYRLPDMSGVDALQEIKDVAPSVPVIIVTAYGDEEVAVEAFRSGARDYLKKPFSISELSAKIDFYLALRLADQRRRKNILLKVDTPVDLGPAPPAVTLSQYRKVQLAVRFLNDNYRTGIHVHDAARAAGISPNHFSRIFRKVMGQSYQDYLSSRRLTKAQSLLRTTTLSVTEICQAVGYSDVTGFGRIFKKLTGHTPTDYRNLPKR